MESLHLVATLTLGEIESPARPRYYSSDLPVHEKGLTEGNLGYEGGGLQTEPCQNLLVHAFQEE